MSKENVSYGPNTLRDGVSLGHQTITRPAVSASEIQALDDLQCYLRSPGIDLITRLDLEFDKMRDVCSSFDKRTIVLSSAMSKVYEQAIYHECVAPGLYLNEEDRRKLTDAQEANFENEAQMKVETDQIQQAIKSETVNELVKQDPKLAQEQAYQEEAQRNIEEAAITQEAEIGEVYD